MDRVNKQNCYTVRRMLATDAAAVVACVIDVYGHAYPQEALYYRQRLSKLIAHEQWVAAIALDADESVVAYSALELSTFGPIAEFGMSMVRTEHRRRGLLERLRNFLNSMAVEFDLDGRFVEIGLWDLSVQKLANRSPTKPCALTLALWPYISHKAMSEDAAAFRRLSFIRYFHYFQAPSEVAVHAPDRHRDIISSIFAQFGIALSRERQAIEPSNKEITIYPNAGQQYSVIRIPRITVSNETQLRIAHLAFRNDPAMQTLYLEFPLGQIECAEFCDFAEQLGFFFSGVMPCAFGTDPAMRLQCLKIDPQLSLLHIGHPFGRELLSYIETETRDINWTI